MMKILKIIQLSAFIIAGSTLKTFSQTQILAFKVPYSATDISRVATMASTTTNANLETSTLSRGTGAGASSSSGYTFNANMTYSATKQEAINNNCYFEFFVQAKSGYKVSLAALNAIIRIQTKGANTYRWMYSINNWVTHTEVGSSDITITDTNNDGEVQAELPISGISDIPASTKIIFRIYAWGGDSSGDNTTTAFGLGKSLSSGRNIISVRGVVAVDTNPLPVNLVSFTGKSNGNGVNLNWSTASEQNNSYFEVLHSTSGQASTIIAKLNGKGTTSVFTDYHFTHTKPVYGTNYYQLRQVDLDGKETLYTPIAVKYNIGQPEFSFYVSNGKLLGNVFSEVPTVGKLTLSNLNGNVIYKQAVKLELGKNAIHIPITINKGVYIGNLITEEGITQTQKFYIK